jgi:membrane protease YdiL (CAAX protease family)
VADRRPVATFLVLLLLASLPFYLLLNLSGGRGEGMRLYVTGLMWCPALAALLACRLSGLPLASLGWGWPPARLAAAAVLLPLAYGAIVYGIAWGTGLGAFSVEDYAAWSGKMLGLPQWSPGAHLALMLALQLSAGLVLSCASALGEEIGWRGLLSPRLAARFGFLRGSLLTGLLWSLLLHASHNVLVTPVFSRMTVDTGPTAYAIDEFGFLLASVSVALAIVFARRPVAAAPA